MPDDKRKGWMDDEERAMFGHKPTRSDPSDTIQDPDPDPEVHNEITDVEVMLTDIRRELEREQGLYGKHSPDSVLRAIISRLHRHVVAASRRVTNKLSYVSQGGMLTEDGEIPPPGMHPCTELSKRLDEVERIQQDLVGVPDGKAGGRVDNLERKVGFWQKLVLGAALMAFTAIGTAIGLAVSYGDARATYRERLEQVTRDLQKHLDDHSNRRDRYPFTLPSPVSGSGASP